MAVKYTIPFYDDSQQNWRVDIDIPGYSGDPIPVTGVGRIFCQPEWNATENEDPYSPIIGSKVQVQFYNRNNDVDVQELQSLSDMEGRLIVYRGTSLWWTGYITPDGIQRYLQPQPYTVTINATDGIALLKDVPFNLPSNWPMPVGVSNRCPLNFIRYALYGTNNLNISLPIRFQCDVESVEYEDSLIFGTVEWGALGEAWTDFNGNSRSAWYVLEGMVKAVQCRLFQFGGKWHLQRINDIVSGTYAWTEVGTETGVAPTVTTGTDDMLADMESYYRFVEENQVMTISAPITDAIVTYDHYQAENIVPNGGVDLWSTGSLLYWGFEAITGDVPNYEQFESLNRREGNAVQLTNDGSATEEAIFTYAGGLPIDANILFKRFTWGFTIMPTQYGFAYDENETIDWSNNPLKVSVQYVLPLDTGTRTYYLNEFGYWQYEGRGLDLGVIFVNVETTYLGSNTNRQEIIFEGSPNVGDVLQVGIRNNPGGGYQWFSFTVTPTEEGNLELALIALRDAITNTRIASKSVVMDNPSRGRIRFQDLINYGTPGGNTYKSGATQPYEFIFPTVSQLKINDIATVAFQGRGGNNEILIPDPGILDGTQDPLVGKLFIKFYVKIGQRYVLDDVYVRVDENNDVYHSHVQAGKRSNTYSTDLSISTSFSGFMLSNMMTSYSKSNTEFIATDGQYTGSLTGMTANAIMRFRSQSSEIFSGSLHTQGHDWQFHHIYMLGGKNFLPLSTKYNIEQCKVDVVAMECRDVEPTLTEKHYGSNDTILSNT